MAAVISIKEATRIIDSGVPFTCRVISYDKKRKRGGKIRDLQGRVAKYDAPTMSTVMGGRALTRMEQLQHTKPKAPQHLKNYTRNIVILQDGFETSLIEKIHPALMIEFNGKKVLV